MVKDITLDIILGDRTTLIGVQSESNNLLGGLKLNNITNETIKGTDFLLMLREF